VNLYSQKIVADANDDRKNHRRQSLAEFFYDFAVMAWGSSHEEMVATTIATIIRYRDDDPDVLALSNFLRNIWQLPAQNTYMHAMQLQGDNKKGKPPRQKVSVESSWPTIAENSLGYLSAELWQIVNDQIQLTWEKTGKQMEPRKGTEKLMRSDALRMTITKCHVILDRLLGNFLPKIYADVAGDLDTPLDIVKFEEVVAQFDHRLLNDAGLWDVARKHSTRDIADDEVDFNGMVALMEAPPPRMKAVFRRNYEHFKDIRCTQEQTDRYFKARYHFYQSLLANDEFDNTKDHTNFVDRLANDLFVDDEVEQAGGHVEFDLTGS